MQQFLRVFCLGAGLYALALACSPNPLPAPVRTAAQLIEYYNDSLPEPLPRFEMIEGGTGLLLCGEKGQPSYLLNPGALDLSHFPADTFWIGSDFDYLTFYDEHEANYNYSASVYSPEDNSRYGPTASLLEISTPALFRKDNPEDSALGYLSVAFHEMAHLTEHFSHSDDLPQMMEQMMLYEADSVLQAAIREENDLLLAAITASDPKGRSAFVDQYLTLKASRVDTTERLLIAAENYYEFVEGYGRFVEHLMQERASGFQDEMLLLTFGPQLRLTQFEDHEWMYKPLHNDYYYVLGFNKYRLLAGAGEWGFIASLKGASKS